MFRKTIIAWTLMILVGSVFGHQGIYVHNADGDRIGEIIDGFAVTSGVEDIVILTSDGYSIAFNMESGQLRDVGMNGFYYKSADCSGQGYLSGQTTTGPGLIGGHIVKTTSATPTFARIDWFVSHQSIEAFSAGKPGACNPLDLYFSDAVPATSIDPATYHIEQIGPDEWGFKKPFSAENERPDAMFCNGFESCPSQ